MLPSLEYLGAPGSKSFFSPRHRKNIAIPMTRVTVQTPGSVFIWPPGSQGFCTECISGFLFFWSVLLWSQYVHYLVAASSFLGPAHPAKSLQLVMKDTLSMGPWGPRLLAPLGPVNIPGLHVCALFSEQENGSCFSVAGLQYPADCCWQGSSLLDWMTKGKTRSANEAQPCQVLWMLWLSLPQLGRQGEHTKKGWVSPLSV